MTDIQILDKALHLFNEKGYFNVGIREIARELEISPGNLTYYFKKKEAILAALLKQLSELNSGVFNAYLSPAPSNARFLEMMRNMFENQFRFRGVHIGNQFVQAEIQQKKIFNYKAVEARRITAYKNIFTGLGQAGQLHVNDEDISFLVSFITVFGRFWIAEATLFNKTPHKDQAIRRYLHILAKQLSLFSTKAGLKSIEAFKI